MVLVKGEDGDVGAGSKGEGEWEGDVERVLLMGESATENGNCIVLGEILGN